MDLPLYEELYRTEKEHWWFKGRRAVTRELINRFIRPQDQNCWSICEVGCGTGGNLDDLADQHDVIGFDASEAALSFAKMRLGDRAIFGMLPDQVDLPRSNYDVVLATDVFEHIEDDKSAAQASLELLRPNGIMVATVPAYQWLYSPRDKHHHHFRRYGKNQFKQLFQLSGFEVELISHYNTLLFPPALASRLWSKATANPNIEIGDLKIPAQPLNRMLGGIFGSESKLLGRVPLPFGLSVVAVIRRVQSHAC